jgi:hypothetical protein
MSRNTADINRHHGGPGSSHQNADKSVDDPKNQPSGWHRILVSPPTQTAAGSAQAGVSGIGIIPMTQRQNRKQAFLGRHR